MTYAVALYAAFDLLILFIVFLAFISVSFSIVDFIILAQQISRDFAVINFDIAFLLIELEASRATSCFAWNSYTVS